MILEKLDFKIFFFTFAPISVIGMNSPGSDTYGQITNFIVCAYTQATLVGLITVKYVLHLLTCAEILKTAT